MLLKGDKEKGRNIKFIKSRKKIVILITLLVIVFLNFGFSFKENSLFVPTNKQIKVKVNFSENPNQEDFFTSTEVGQFTYLGPFELLEGVWSGNYELNQNSVFWTNPNLDKSKIYDLINFGHYNIALKFNLTEDKRLSYLEIVQEDVKYDPATIQLVRDTQVNYWTKAKYKDWLEIVRGKIFKKDSNDLLTVFQTTVYENKVPIYAFKGEAILKMSK